MGIWITCAGLVFFVLIVQRATEQSKQIKELKSQYSKAYNALSRDYQDLQKKYQKVEQKLEYAEDKADYIQEKKEKELKNANLEIEKIKNRYKTLLREINNLEVFKYLAPRQIAPLPRNTEIDGMEFYEDFSDHTSRGVFITRYGDGRITVDISYYKGKHTTYETTDINDPSFHDYFRKLRTFKLDPFDVYRKVVQDDAKKKSLEAQERRRQLKALK